MNEEQKFETKEKMKDTEILKNKEDWTQTDKNQTERSVKQARTMMNN